MLLHRALEGQGPQPFEHFIGRLCEEFSCLPSEAWAEWLRLPAGFLEQIVEYRRYAQMKFAVDAATTPAERARIRATPLGALAERNMVELAEEEING